MTGKDVTDQFRKSQSLLYEVWFPIALDEHKRDSKSRNPFFMRSGFL